MRWLLFALYGFTLTGLSNMAKKRNKVPRRLDFWNMLQKRTYTRNCSLGRSAVVWEILSEKFYPVYEQYELTVPVKCPFHSERNMYYHVELNKEKISNSNWKCNICGKQFYGENFLYYHMDRKHREKFQTKKEHICLADYCDIFRCNLHSQYPVVRSNFGPCNDKSVRNLQRKCEKLLAQCLPDKMHHFVYDAIFTSICSTLTCDDFYTQFEDISLLTVLMWFLAVSLSFFILCYLCSMCWENWEEEVNNTDKKRKDEIDMFALATWQKNRYETYHNLRRR